MFKSFVTLLMHMDLTSLALITMIIGNEYDMSIGLRVLMFGFALSGLNLGLVIQRCLRQ